MASQEERDRIMAEYMAGVQDDDEEDEGDFMPDGDNDDSSDEDEVEQEDFVVLSGSLRMREDRLVYSGTWKATTGGERKFKLKSIPQKLPLHWDASRPTVSDPGKKQIPPMRTLVFNGFFVSMEGNKMKERDVAMTFTLTESEEKSPSRLNGKSLKDDNEEDGKLPSKPAAKNYKDDGDKADCKMPAKPASQEPGNDDDDSKMPSDSKLSPTKAHAPNGNTDFVYRVFGRGTNDFGSFELEGTWEHNVSGDLLVCKKRYVQSGGAAAAASAASSDDDADDGVDMNELIALHQDAGLSVEELRKRYRGDGGASQNDSGKRQCVEESDEEEFDGF